jgi:glycine oxidase
VGILIIGGGIIGLSIAYYLSRRNFSDVLLLERDPELTLHASGHNAGGIAGMHESKPLLWPLVRETHKLYKELVEGQHFDFDFERNGTISLDPSLDEKTTEEIARRFKEESGGSIEFLDASDLQKREPNLSTTFSQCALFYPDDAQGNSMKLGRCFSRACLDQGIEMETGAEVLDFEFDDQKITKVKTSMGSFVSDTVVLAAGPWSGILSGKFGYEMPMTPIKGHLITTEASPGLIHSFIDGPHYYVVQTGMGKLVVGGGEDDAGFDLSVSERRIREAWEEGTTMIPKLLSLKQEAKTACLRPFTPEGIPILGKSARFSNVLFATGHYKNGFCLAPVTGKIISELIIEGESKIDIASYSPDRFP